MIRLEAVSKRYPNGTVAVRELTLEVADGEVAVLVGPSGCGKTTLLRMINRLIEPTGGRIYLEEEDVTHVDPVQLRRRIGYVIQQIGLFPHQTIEHNVATVPTTARLGQEAATRARRRAARNSSASIPSSTATAIRTNSRVGNANASAWRVRSPRIHRCC